MGRGGIPGMLPLGVWISTTILGLWVFAWVLRRPQREADSPLAAALAMVAAAHEGFRRDVPKQASGTGDASASPAEAASAIDDWAPLRSDASRLSGNRPTGWQARPALHFDKPAARDVVRRQITYRLVRLSDAPDDLRSTELMRLDRGDEIEIVGQELSFLQVRTPTGEIGWIPSVSIIG
jgi:hypothetical protein